MAKLDDLKEELRIQEQIVKEKLAANTAAQASQVLTEAEKKAAKEALKLAREKSVRINKSILSLQSELKLQKDIASAQSSALKSFNRLSQDVKASLTGATGLAASVYGTLSSNVAKLGAIQTNLNTKEGKFVEEELDRISQRLGMQQDLTSETLSQAQAAVKLNNELRGGDEFEQRRTDAAAMYNALKEETLKSLQTEEERLLALTSSEGEKKKIIEDIERQRQKALQTLTSESKQIQEGIDLLEEKTRENQRLEQIQENQKSLYEMVPESMQKAVGFAKGLGSSLKAGGASLLAFTLLVGIVGAVIKSFTSLDDAAKEFRTETGLTNSQMEGIKSQANDIVGQFANLGIEAKDVFDTVAKLKSEFSDTVGFSDEVVAGLTVLGKNFGVSAENAAKVQGVLESIGGLSAETATSVQLQVANMSKLAGVAPAKVFEDMAGSAEIASTLFRGNIESFAKATVEARRLGTTITKMGEAAKGLLDFESGITEELTAAAMLGGDFNLTRARSLAYSGDLVGMQNELLDQIQKTGDFSKKDLFTQEQIAKATGMSVEEINKQLNVREKLKSLSSEEQKLAEQAMAAGLDLSNIKKEDLATQVKAFSKQQEQQASLEQINNIFMGIVATVGSALVPVLELVSKTLTFILDNTAGLVAFTTTLVGLFGVIYGIKVKTFAVARLQAFAEARAAGKSVIGAVASIFGGQGKLPIIGAVIAAGMVGALFAALGKASSYDTAGDLSSPADGKTIISTKEGGLFKLSPNDDVAAAPGLVDALSGNPSLGEITMGGRTTETTTPSVSVDVSELITEMKALRADLNSGKIAVYMDGKKVTASVSRVVDKVGTNSYGLG